MNPEKAAERVLVIPTSRFEAAGRFHGFRPHDAKYSKAILEATHFEFRLRGEVETDPSFKQLIPYVVLSWNDQVFHYTRIGGGERRLDSLRSVGIGGHINDIDAGIDPYRTGMLRELREEVAVDSPYTEELLGFIFDDSTAVGEVHLGIVHHLRLEEPLVFARESGIDESGFAPLRDLLHHRSDFETWSQLVMEYLVDRQRPGM